MMSSAAPVVPELLRVGCAGWSLSRSDQEAFGAGDSALQRYATRLPMVEINSSFYRPHQAKTYARWAASVPEGFRFAVKLPREISHERRLRDAMQPLERFLEGVLELGGKLGPLLLQLPPSLVYDTDTAEAFLRGLRAHAGRSSVRAAPSELVYGGRGCAAERAWRCTGSRRSGTCAGGSGSRR